MVPSDAELCGSDDSSMVEAGDDARDSSSGSPRMFWMLNGCIVELELFEAKLLIINNSYCVNLLKMGRSQKSKMGARDVV